MAKARSPLVIIFITVLIDLIGFGIVIPVLPLYAQRFGASPALIGAILASYSGMQFIFSPILGRLSDRVGRRPVLLFSMIGSAIGFVVMGIGGAIWVLFLARAIDGVSGGNISTAQAYIADVTPPEKRSAGMGLIGAAFGIGFILGPAIGGILSKVSLSAPFYFAAGLALCNAIALFFLLPESLTPELRGEARKRASISDVFSHAVNRQLPAVMATNFFATVAFALLTAIYSLVTFKRFNLDETHNGYIFAYLGLLGAIIQGGLLRRYAGVVGEKTLAVAGVAILALSLFMLPVAGTIAALILASTGIAIGNSLVTPTLNALASTSVGPAWQGRALGLMQSSSSLARIIGPLLGGWLLGMDVNTPHAGRTPFWSAGGIMIVALIIAAALPVSWAATRAKSVPVAIPE